MNPSISCRLSLHQSSSMNRDRNATTTETVFAAQAGSEQDRPQRIWNLSVPLTLPGAQRISRPSVRSASLVDVDRGCAIVIAPLVDAASVLSRLVLAFPPNETTLISQELTCFCPVCHDTTQNRCCTPTYTPDWLCPVKGLSLETVVPALFGNSPKFADLLLRVVAICMFSMVRFEKL